MDVGHSRLLKFFVKQPKMEQHTLKIENLGPSEIECEVPRQQKLREDVPIENKPEILNEAQIEWEVLRDMVKKPIYMGLQEEVILSPHQIRPPSVQQETIGKTDKTPEKPQTRIPVSRFKPAAERVLKEKRDALKSKREAPEKPRHTSIPKLKERTVAKKNPPTDEVRPINTEIKAKEVKEETSLKTNLKRTTRKDRIPVMSKDHYKLTKKEVKKDEPVKTDSLEKFDDELINFMKK
ncbi:uncharacterized protein LOC125239754 [Leguminivora glycinivorella]|uniref:uncharacterized protein LOC125239754 n=1 Tax=Leguminivora glycinivorella TaxID=1035111 RepID=UPI00201071D3|nr:uncharacterized protein LOC125239754 [Leguminivora glycinivorella]XP_048003377.1 uncharacterized protein LOC125239754 [Leguminivora glycinivorella]XP_048003378.1 uncharacterized protein LOC125239754 [Leguminivora glycinivorella]XP_048003379.1 uncharacterized protein LOC125239754 [Leguminivora glycinivorella]XP_048003381.1 uncharacterized protein LOC125239754 [Leguminivora glycinivorella]